ncbi:MAG: DUF2029 domain-containing protein [Pseudonocardiaceae bacterium]|nr:DUF2029 domain-containing protein [Pseudonocardiaceae bacterium]
MTGLRAEPKAESAAGDRRLLLGVVLAVTGLGIGIGVVAGLAGWQLGADSAVYRAGALSLLHDRPLYGTGLLEFLPNWATLPFIYPPSAAMLFAPLATVPVGLAWGLFVAASVLGVFAVVRAVLGTVRAGSDWGAPAWVASGTAAVGLTVLLLALEPVWKTLFLGQINLILMTLVVLDVLVVGAAGKRWGGVLVGVAAAVKLTPLIFIAHLLVLGRRADAARGLCTFAGLQVLTFALVPWQAAGYWSDVGTDLELVNTGNWIFNQSLNGMMIRLADGAVWSTDVAVAVGALLAMPAVWLVRQYAMRGDAAAALLVTAFYGLLLSPLSWSHHWVWVVPFVVLLVARGRWLAAGAAFLGFASCVVMIVPNGRDTEFNWGPVEFVFGNAYVFFPVLLGAVLCARALTGPSRVGVPSHPG